MLKQNLIDLCRVSGLFFVAASGVVPAVVHGAAGVSELPLIEVPATAATTDTIAVIVSGDGGWTKIDRSLTRDLTAQGISVVGMNSLRYFWHARTPDEAANALERILRHYLSAWQKQQVLLIGYSRGADVMPFMASRLPDDLRARVDLVALLGPATSISFSFHFTDWLGVKRRDAVPTLPEIGKLAGLKTLCVYGAKERDSVCPLLPAGLAILDEVPGGHHFGGDYERVAEKIIAAASRSRS